MKPPRKHESTFNDERQIWTCWCGYVTGSSTDLARHELRGLPASSPPQSALKELIAKWLKSADNAQAHLYDSGMETENATHMNDMRMCAVELGAAINMNICYQCAKGNHGDCEVENCYCLPCERDREYRAASFPHPQEARICPLCDAGLPLGPNLPSGHFRDLSVPDSFAGWCRKKLSEADYQRLYVAPQEFPNATPGPQLNINQCAALLGAAQKDLGEPEFSIWYPYMREAVEILRSWQP